MLFKLVLGKSNSNAAPNRRVGPSILNSGLAVSGDIYSEGEVHITGSVEGNITANKLTLGRGGSVNGTVEAETAVINGVLSGRLSAMMVVLGGSAHVNADISYVSMRIEPGAIFEGFSRRVERLEIAAPAARLMPPNSAVEPLAG
jgi:cytoskeletal protein CcmA (bactofilin family)